MPAAAAVVLSDSVLPVLGHRGAHFGEARTQARALDWIQSRHPQAEFQLICGHLEITVHQVEVGHVVVRIGKIAGGMGGLRDQPGLIGGGLTVAGGLMAAIGLLRVFRHRRLHPWVDPADA